MRRQSAPRRRRTEACRWHGLHRGETGVGVLIGWPCGHTDRHPTPTCAGHLDHLLSQGGRADNPAPCPVCQTVGSAAVTATHDLNA